MGEHESKSSGGKGQRFPMTGTIQEIGNDISKIKDMGIQHIVLGLLILLESFMSSTKDHVIFSVSIVEEFIEMTRLRRFL
jgi:hypothetical protein